MRRLLLLLVLGTFLWGIIPSRAQTNPVEAMFDEASRAADAVRSYYRQLNQEMWMESHDLDQMPPPREPDQRNIGRGPVEWVETVFQGTDLQRKRDLRESWSREAKTLMDQITAAMQAIIVEHKKLAGKSPDAAYGNPDNTTTWRYTDPKLQQAANNIASLHNQIEERTRKLRPILDHIAVANGIIEKELLRIADSRPESLSGLWTFVDPREEKEPKTLWPMTLTVKGNTVEGQGKTYLWKGMIDGRTLWLRREMVRDDYIDEEGQAAPDYAISAIQNHRPKVDYITFKLTIQDSGHMSGKQYIPNVSWKNGNVWGFERGTKEVSKEEFQFVRPGK